MADFGWSFGATDKELAGCCPGLSDPPNADVALQPIADEQGGEFDLSD
jgi:hypothetical protein